MRAFLPFIAIAISIPAFAYGPQTPPPDSVVVKSQAKPDPLSSFNQGFFEREKAILLATAEKMPEADYGYKPVDSVRTFGQIVAHVADTNYYFGSLVLGEKNPSPGVEKTKTTKAELVAALKDSLAYADKAYAGLTDTAATQTVKFRGEDTPKLSVLSINNAHNFEHYGNLVTYLRMKGLVPPTSDPGFRTASK